MELNHFSIKWKSTMTFNDIGGGKKPIAYERNEPVVRRALFFYAHRPIVITDRIAVSLNVNCSSPSGVNNKHQCI